MLGLEATKLEHGPPLYIYRILHALSESSRKEKKKKSVENELNA